MIPVHFFIEIYISFAFMCAVPWLVNWATNGEMPVTVRILAMLVFSMFFVECSSALWRVYAEVPDRLRDATRLVGPIILFSFIGMYFVVQSLVKLVVASRENNDKTD